MEDIKITNEYSYKLGFSGGGYQKTVWIQSVGYPYREGENKLPRQMAWCNKCAQESSKVVAPIWLNNRHGYALKCIKCGGEHHMYVDMYVSRYIGRDMGGGGHISPTKGILTQRQSMDRKGIDSLNEIPKKVEKDICKAFGYTHEEYQEMRKEWEEKERKARKRLNNEQANQRAEYRNKEIKSASDKRKELIQKGVLKYKKGIGLVNTETGEVLKL